MAEQGAQSSKPDLSVGRVIVCAILVLIALWLGYSGFEKYQLSGVKTQACVKKCTEEGYTGYSFQWPMLSGPQCTCLGSPQ